MDELSIPEVEDVAVEYRRVKDVASARSIHRALERADEKASRDRARLQRMLDGGAPYRSEDLQKAGMRDATNVNFGQGEALLAKAQVSYINVLASVKTLAYIPISSGNKQRDARYSQIVSEEFHRLVTKRDKRFVYKFQLNSHNFLSEGVSICWWPDYHDFRYEVSGLNDFKVPRKASVAGEGVSVVSVVRHMTPSELFNYIRDEKAAADIGWNVDAVKQAIVEAVADSQKSSSRSWRSHWESLVEDLKNNDLFYDATAPAIECVHMWVEELSGKVTHYFFPYAPLDTKTLQGEDDFLYVKEDAYEHMGSAFVPFTYGIGTNGKFHSIRGLSWKMFPHVQLMNRMWCRRADSSMLSSSLIVQPIDEDAGAKAQMMFRGPLAVLPPGMTVADARMDNMGEQSSRMLGDLDSLLRSNTGQYTADNAFQGSKERTRFEVAAQLEQDAEMSGTAQQMFYMPLELVLQEQFRRVINSSDGHHGYELVREFFDRCLERGVEREWITEVDPVDVSVVKAVGNGSQAMRRLYLDEVRDMAPVLDDVGRRNALFDWIAARFGYEQAERYFPAEEEERMPIDAQIAELQNYQLLEGKEVVILSGENLIVHARVHVSKLMEMKQQVDTGELDIAEAAVAMQLLHAHATDTLEAVGADQTVEQEAAMLRQALQQLGEIMVNGLRKARRQMEQENVQQAIQGGQGAGEGGTDLERQNKMLQNEMLMQKIQADNERLQMQREKHQLDAQLAVQKASLDRAKLESRNKIDLARMLR